MVKKTFDGTKFQELKSIAGKSQTKEPSQEESRRECKENQSSGSRTRRSFGGVPSRQLQERNSLMNVIPLNHHVEKDVLTSLVPRTKEMKGDRNYSKLINTCHLKIQLFIKTLTSFIRLYLKLKVTIRLIHNACIFKRIVLNVIFF